MSLSPCRDCDNVTFSPLLIMSWPRHSPALVTSDVSGPGWGNVASFDREKIWKTKKKNVRLANQRIRYIDAKDQFIVWWITSTLRWPWLMRRRVNPPSCLASEHHSSGPDRMSRAGTGHWTLDTGGSGGYFLRMAPVTESRDQPGLQRLTPPVPSLLPILKLNLRSADSPIITNRNLSCSIIHKVMLCSTVTSRIANSSLIWWTRIWHKTWSLRDSPSRDLTPTSIFWETGTRGTRPGISVLQTAESA